jgi:hypothetical protein
VRPHDLDSAASPDPARLAVFREYLRLEYAGPFIDGMGSYEILQMARDRHHLQHPGQVTA